MFQDQPDRDEIVFVGRSNMGKSTLMRELTDHNKFTAGKRPGATRRPNHFDWNAEKFVFTDPPGFGFASGVDRDTREVTKTDITQYIEEYTNDILAMILVVNGKSVIDIIDRYTTEDPIPYNVGMLFLLGELDIPAVVAVNKMDKVDDRDERLSDLCDRPGLFPPWKQWRSVIAPTMAKRGDISHLEDAPRSHLHEQGCNDLSKFL